MSRTSHPVKHLAAAGALTLALLGTASSAQAASLTLNESCVFPLIGAQPLSIAINASIPTAVAAGASAGSFDIKATALASGNAPAGLNILGVKTLEGSAKATATLSATSLNLPLKVPIAIPKQTVRGTTANVPIAATGSTPDIAFPAAGPGKVTVDALTLSLTARDAADAVVPLRSATDSDNNPDTFDVTCTATPGQNTTLANIDVTAPGTSSTPAEPVSQPAAPAPAPFDGAPTVVDYGYDLAGSATLRNLVSGVLPLTGTIGAHLSLPTGAFTGDLKLNPTTSNLRAAGILPVRATVQLVPTDVVTGSLTGGVLKAKATVAIKLTSVTLAGIPLISGANCRALTPSVINLQSTGKFFQPLSGGTLAATFSIGDLVGCGPLNGIVSPLTKGGGNAIALQLTPNV